jgi:hypothetical protein
MNPSNPNRHRQTTSLVTGAGHYGHCVEDQICWGIKKFVHKHPAAHRVVGLLVTGADNQTRTAADPRPQHLRNPSPTPAVTVRTI